jgi:malate/lactate dehydrogenase
VRVAEHKEAGQCDVIVVTAGAAQKEGTSHLIQFNSAIQNTIVIEAWYW